MRACVYVRVHCLYINIVSPLLACNKHKYRTAIIESRSVSLYSRCLYISFRANEAIDEVYCEIITLCVKENKLLVAVKFIARDYRKLVLKIETN